MPDDLANALAQLRNQRTPSAFAEPSAVRARGRQRSRRQAVGAAIAVLAVLGTGAGTVTAIAGRPDRHPVPAASVSSGAPSGTAHTPGPGESRSPSPSASTKPRRTEDLGRLVLQPSDVAPDAVRTDAADVLEGRRWYFANLCAAYQAQEYPSVQHRSGVLTADWVVANNQITTRGVIEIVELYEPSWGARNLADVELAVNRCGPSAQSPGASTTWELVDRGFAGDESLLIKMTDAERPDPIQLYAVVRVGEVVATVLTPIGPDGETYQQKEAYLRQLAERTAVRLGSG